MGLSLFVYIPCQANRAEHPPYNVPVAPRVGERVVVGVGHPTGHLGLSPASAASF